MLLQLSILVLPSLSAWSDPLEHMVFGVAGRLLMSFCGAVTFWVVRPLWRVNGLGIVYCRFGKSCTCCHHHTCVSLFSVRLGPCQLLSFFHANLRTLKAKGNSFTRVRKTLRSHSSCSFFICLARSWSSRWRPKPLITTGSFSLGGTGWTSGLNVHSLTSCISICNRSCSKFFALSCHGEPVYWLQCSSNNRNILTWFRFSHCWLLLRSLTRHKIGKS